MRLSIIASVACFLSLSPAFAQTHWVASWAAAASPELPTEAERAKGHLELDNQTIRNIVHLSIGGNRIRIRVSNEFGAETVQIGAAHVANCTAEGRMMPGSDQAVTFSGRPAFNIPPNAPFLSDPVDLNVAAGGNLCISLYLPAKTTAAGIHYAAQQKNYIATGNLTAAEDLPEATTISSWLFLAGVDVTAPEATGAIVAFGDSITDGAHSTENANHRWPNFLADRLLAVHKNVAVVDEGIGGNRILHDAISPVVFGVNALARFQRDALGQPGAKYVIVLEGINDLGHAGTSAPLSETVSADDLIAAMKQMIERAHEHQIKIFGATLTPFGGTTIKGYYTPEKDEKRKRVNEWMRTSGAFDGVIDFEKAVADPANPDGMLPAYDSGDHLHPSDAGYKAMADAIDLALFQ
jgi:lysophospholipase L1-like esterase